MKHGVYTVILGKLHCHLKKWSIGITLKPGLNYTAILGYITLQLHKGSMGIAMKFLDTLHCNTRGILHCNFRLNYIVILVNKKDKSLIVTRSERLTWFT